MWKQFLSDYLGFSKKERTGIFVLLFLIGLFSVLPLFYPFFIKKPSYDNRSFAAAVAALRLKQADSSGEAEERYPSRPQYQHFKSGYAGKEAYRPKGELFYFDPNKATMSDWQRLGIRDKTIATIQHYLSKGGRFYKKEDLGKIWGLHKDEVERMMPFVQIAKEQHPTATYETKGFEKKEYKKSIASLGSVDVNLADSAALMALPGIGAKLSQRIIHFREKLGGFYKLEQIGETFGLPDSSFQKIKPYLKTGAGPVNKIDINKASADELKAHPYIRYALANAIVQYRAQHGNFKSVDELKKIMLLTDEVFEKAAPYLTVTP